MTLSQIEYKKTLIKHIQINKKNRFIDDEQRKDFIKSRFNCDSLKELSIDKLKLMLAYCKNEIKDIPLEDPISDRQRYKLVQLWGDKPSIQDKSIKALNVFVERITDTNSYTNLTKSQAIKVILAVEKL